MSKGFSGMPGNMQGLLKQAQKMQEDLKKMQDEAENMTSDGSAGGGMVKAVVNGKFHIVSLELDPQVVSNDDIDMLKDLVKAAVNQAVDKVQAEMKSKMAGVTGGLSIPGLL